jgi:hypothetical protein
MALICLAGAQPSVSSGACVHEVVVRGIPEMACRSVGGQMAAARFVSEHPLYGTDKWKFGGWGCVKGSRPREHRVNFTPTRGTDQRACWPRLERRCVWHRGAQTVLCFDIKIGCKNELASG